MADELPRGGIPGVSSQGDLVSSGSSLSNDDASGGGIDWGSIGKVAPLAGATVGAYLSSKGGDANTDIKSVQANIAKTGAEGQQLAAAGQDALGPVLKYFQALSSGDPSQALAATMPQRGRIIDQYDAARRSASQFGPRGGGQASSQLESRTREASDLASTTSQARSEGAKALASLGSDLTKTGLSAEEQSNQAMASVLGPLLQQQEQSAKSKGSFWAGIGKIAGSIALDVFTGGAAIPYTAAITASGAGDVAGNASAVF